MTPQTLYVKREPLGERLTIGLLRRYILDEAPLWISLEPRPWLLERDGRRLTGRLPGLEPLARSLPENLDDLPLYTASLYAQDYWQHFHDAQPLSGWPGQCITFSLAATQDSRAFKTLVKRQQVLSWQDRQRFGLAANSMLPSVLESEHFYHQENGKRLTWRLIPMEASR